MQDPYFVGPNFASGATTFGRARLPSGLVAITTSGEKQRAAIAELHAYALNVRVPNRPRRGIVYRFVEQWEADAMTHKLRNFYGTRKADSYESLFAFVVGHPHVIDDSAISHACNRHAINEQAHDHQIVAVSDFQSIPEIVDPRHVIEFSVVKNMPRVIYEHEREGRTLVVIEELQRKAGSAVRTMYKRG